MWMGYSQLLCCSGEQTWLGSLQVIMPKVAQSRELWSKPREAEMQSSPGENVHKEELWLSFSQALQGKGQHPSFIVQMFLEGRISGREVTPCLTAP